MKKAFLILIPFLVVSLSSCPSPVAPESTTAPSPSATTTPTAAPTVAPTPTPDANPPALSSLTAPVVIRDDQGFDVSITAIDPEGSPLTLGLYDGATLLCPLTLSSGDTYSAQYAGFATEQTYSNLSIRAKDSWGNETSASIPSLYVQSTNSSLSNIRTTVGSLSPAFSPSTTRYEIRVRRGSRVNVTATRASQKATATMSQSSSGSRMTATYTVTAEAGAPYVTVYTVIVISQ